MVKLCDPPDRLHRSSSSHRSPRSGRHCRGTGDTDGPAIRPFETEVKRHGGNEPRPDASAWIRLIPPALRPLQALSAKSLLEDGR